MTFIKVQNIFHLHLTSKQVSEFDLSISALESLSFCFPTKSTAEGRWGNSPSWRPVSFTTSNVSGDNADVFGVESDLLKNSLNPADEGFFANEPKLLMPVLLFFFSFGLPWCRCFFNRISRALCRQSCSRWFLFTMSSSTRSLRHKN